MVELVNGYQVSAAIGAVRLLMDAGLFEELDDARVGLTARGGMLREDVPGSVRRGANVVSEEW